jgi:hypothetical protein
MDSVSVKKFCFVSWNVQGLGDPDKCAVVKDAVAAACPTILCLQETKLASLIPRNSALSYLPIPPALPKKTPMTVAAALSPLGTRTP